MLKLIPLLFILTISSAHAQLTSDSLIGIWQDSPSLGSGWGDCYRFFDDGTFIYSHNQMNCQDSIIEESGLYKVKKNKLILHYNEIVFIGGGTLQKSTGSCGSDYELVGGQEDSISRFRKEKIKLVGYIYDKDYDYLKCIKLDGYKHWRLAIDPDGYD